jgi:hypothetical protein
MRPHAPSRQTGSVQRIHHVCVRREIGETAKVVDAWEGTLAGVKLSDHSGVVVACDAAPDALEDT